MGEGAGQAGRGGSREKNEGEERKRGRGVAEEMEGGTRFQIPDRASCVQ